MVRAKPAHLEFRGDFYGTGSPPRLHPTVVQRLEGHWRAAAEIDVRDGQAEVAGLRIFWSWEAEVPMPGEDRARGIEQRERPGALPAGVLREVQLRAITEFAQQSLLKEARAIGPAPGEELKPAPKRAGRRRTSNRVLAEVAAVYVDELVRGRRGVIRRTAERLRQGGRAVDEGYVRKAIEEARRRRLLTATGRGQAGGSLTDEAHAILSADKQRKST